MPTKTFDLTTTDWTDLGETPCFVQATDDGPVTFVIDTQAPATPGVIGHKIGAHIGEATADIGLQGQHVFARALSEPATVAVSR